MNLKALVLTSLIAVTAQAGLPEGQFRGQGLWKSGSDQGTYQVTNRITKNTVKAVYSSPKGPQHEWNFDMAATSNGFFNVKSQGKVVGQGYCLEKANVCHYQLTLDRVFLEETLTVMGGKLYRFGSKDVGSVRIMWQESLDKN